MEPYNLKVITFPDLSTQVRVYSSPVMYKERPSPEYERNPFDGKCIRSTVDDFDVRQEHVMEVSYKRTKGKVYQYARSNDWDWFVTLTFSPDKVDRYDYDVCIKKLKPWLDNLRRSSPFLSYLVVPERHKDGAWHFHGLFSGVDDKVIVWTGKWVIKRLRASGRRSRFVRSDEKIYKFGSYKLGWMTATRVRQKDRVMSYITKYITKDLCAASVGRKRYWCSRNLLLPVEEVYNLEANDKFVLDTELSEDARFSKVSVVQYGDMTQCVKIYEL